MPTKEDLLWALTVTQLRKLAKDNKIKLIREGLLWDSPATRKEDIIELLLGSSRITKKKIQEVSKGTVKPKKIVKPSKKDVITTPKKEPSPYTKQSVTEIVASINRWKKVAPKVTGKGKEKKMTLSMTGYLASAYPDITLEHNLGGNRIDAVIKKIGIEAKYRPNQNEINRLYGQVDDYLRYLEHIIVVFLDTNQSMINNFRRKIETGRYASQVTLVSA